MPNNNFTGNFDYFSKARKLADNARLLAIIERITDRRINLTASCRFCTPPSRSSSTNVRTESLWSKLCATA